ncbi:MAG: ATP12 family protein [Pseudomonadota bacterium]
MMPRQNGASSTPTAEERLKKFYQAADIKEENDGAFAVVLDGKPVRTPSRALLKAPARAAEAIAAEWNAQDVFIEPLTMPLTRLANTAIDGVTAARESVAEDIVKIAGNDLLVYRADRPQGLVERQAAHWDPILTRFESRFRVSVRTTSGIMPVTQHDDLAPAVRATLPGEPMPLAALHQLTTLTGSALIALGLLDGTLSFAGAWDAAHVDEDWNIKEWGEDAEAVERRANRRRDAEAAAFLLRETL